MSPEVTTIAKRAMNDCTFIVDRDCTFIVVDNNTSEDAIADMVRECNAI